MKTKIKFLFCVISITFFSSKAFSQASFANPATGHAGAGNPTWWCGWDAATPFSFNLEHRGTADINFLTGGTQRMTIRGTGAGTGAGNVGIGSTAIDNFLRLDVIATPVAIGNSQWLVPVPTVTAGTLINVTSEVLFRGSVADNNTSYIALRNGPISITNLFFMAPNPMLQARFGSALFAEKAKRS